jgi:hypothetical protein
MIMLGSFLLAIGGPVLGQPPNPQQPPTIPETPVPGQRQPELPETPVPGQRDPGMPPDSTPPDRPPTPPDGTGGDPATTPGRFENLLGTSPSASQGRIGQIDLQYQPFLRAGEVLESIPGLIVTQHSGSGKANQYFLRGFNLDHGTDFSVYVDGVPVNFPTHAHGQGYLDLNWLIPELVEWIDFKKGPYYAEVGDFSSAGSASIRLFETLPEGIARVEIGEDAYYRVLVADSMELGAGQLLYALEYQYYDGPWEVPEDFTKYNGFVKYLEGDCDDGFTLTFLGYKSDWIATDQIPLRAVESGLVSRLGALDPTDGGRTARYGVNAQRWYEWEDGSITRANVFATYYRLNLFSNFTFFLDDPVNGDQFEQADRRLVSGLNLSHEWCTDFCGRDAKTTVGLQVRNDDIPEVGLHRTVARQRLSTVRENAVNETSLGVFLNEEIRWSDKVRTILGVRGDIYWVEVEDEAIPENSGRESDEIVSPKFALILGPWDDTEYYLNLGMGFHSNDARGVLTTLDPVTGEVVEPSPLLVRTRGAEIGMRSRAVENLNTTVALWYLEIDSEILFVGDAGTTEASRASRRYGVEWTNTYVLNSWLSIDADLAATNSRFIETDPAGEFIPGAIGTVVSIGPTVKCDNGLFATLRYRYFGPRPLIEDNRVRSDSTTVVNLGLGYERENLQIGLNVFNLLDSTDHDIDYFYASRLPGEPDEGVEDIHFHPVEPRTMRFYLRWNY